MDGRPAYLHIKSRYMIGLQVFIAHRSGRRTEDMGEQRVADRPFIPCDESNHAVSVDIHCLDRLIVDVRIGMPSLRSFVVLSRLSRDSSKDTALREKVTPCGEQAVFKCESIDIPMLELSGQTVA
jgi:hypothetical protein